MRGFKSVISAGIKPKQLHALGESSVMNIRLNSINELTLTDNYLKRPKEKRGGDDIELSLILFG